MFHCLVNMLHFYRTSFSCTVARVLNLECFLANIPFQPLSGPGVERHSGLASPICVPSSREFTYINTCSGCFWRQKHKDFAKVLQTTSWFPLSPVPKAQGVLPWPLWVQSSSLALSFDHFPLPVSWHSHIQLQCGKESHLISSGYSRKYLAPHPTWHAATLKTFLCHVVIPRWAEPAVLCRPEAWVDLSPGSPFPLLMPGPHPGRDDPAAPGYILNMCIFKMLPRYFSEVPPPLPLANINTTCTPVFGATLGNGF